MPNCIVMGSINMDMVTCMDEFPVPGETRRGTSFTTTCGGKGANQAVALAKLGMNVGMAGMLGKDTFGKTYLAHFANVGVDCSQIAALDEYGTGTATITVNGHGENCIVIVPGANVQWTDAWVDSVLENTPDANLYLLQLEVNLDVCYRAIRRLKALGKTVMLDPAPAAPIPQDVLACVDYITPNETELRIITADLPESASVEQRMQSLLDKGVGCVVHKSGADGAYVTTEQGIVHVAGYKVHAVDTTAAGDTFNAGFAAGLMRGLSLTDAVRLGNAAGALAVTKLGAQAGMPTMEQVHALMEEQK